jgi:hypothetical protein
MVAFVAFWGVSFAPIASGQENGGTTVPPRVMSTYPTPGSGRNPNVAANPSVEDMYVPPKAGEPFTGKSTVTWTWSTADGPVTRVLFANMLARDSSGKLYFENRRAIGESGEMVP